MELPQITFDFNDPDSEKKEGNKKSGLGKAEPGKDLNSSIKVKPTRGRKNLKDIVDIDLIEIPEDEILFKKLYYSIGDVSKMFNENASLIRYWENEFDILKPKKNAKGDRFFRPEDVKNLKLIHHLLRQRKYTIEGAKEFLKSNKTAAEKFEMIRSLQKLKSFLNELKASL
ncbi:MAG TPA: MerR family transcriptional regulator [Chitinophagaceae bacterium]|nr:MerR family transcriptional regulator [Chitinophagaceae bacterium]